MSHVVEFLGEFRLFSGGFSAGFSADFLADFLADFSADILVNFRSFSAGLHVEV